MPSQKLMLQGRLSLVGIALGIESAKKKHRRHISACGVRDAIQNWIDRGEISAYIARSRSGVSGFQRAVVSLLAATMGI